MVACAMLPLEQPSREPYWNLHPRIPANQMLPLPANLIASAARIVVSRPTVELTKRSGRSAFGVALSKGRLAPGQSTITTRSQDASTVARQVASFKLPPAGVFHLLDTLRYSFQNDRAKLREIPISHLWLTFIEFNDVADETRLCRFLEESTVSDVQIESFLQIRKLSIPISCIGYDIGRSLGIYL